MAPEDPNFSAFVFKIQANMDPKHHDRVAFMRICSGVFEKGASVLHRQSGKMIRLSQPQQFLATERQTVEKAYPGDIIGVFDTGELGVGDTVCEKKHPVTFIDFPVFPPELFARLSPVSSMKRKQFLNGVTQLAQEGAIQVYKQPYIMESFIIGAVGQLQFEVMKYRLENEYNVSVNLEPLGFTAARWTEGDVPPEELVGIDNAMVVYDRRERRCISCPMPGRQAGWPREIQKSNSSKARPWVWQNWKEINQKQQNRRWLCCFFAFWRAQRVSQQNVFHALWHRKGNPVTLTSYGQALLGLEG